MLHFSECSTVVANCNAETQIKMRDGTVEHFPGQRVHDLFLGGLFGHREGLPEGHDHHRLPLLVAPVVRQVHVVEQLYAPRTPANIGSEWWSNKNGSKNASD